MCSLTTFLTTIFGVLIPIIYLFLGFVFGAESAYLGIGALIGSVLNIVATNIYLKTQGAMSGAPALGNIASIGFIVSFAITLLLKYILNYPINDINYSLIFIIICILGIVSNTVLKNSHKKSVKNLLDSVIKYKIVNKYKDDPRWAIYLYLNNGVETWNKTITGSFCAKHPEKDLTFVFETREKALDYAKRSFKNAKFIDEENKNPPPEGVVLS